MTKKFHLQCCIAGTLLHIFYAGRRYLMDPDMNFVKFFGKNYDADNLADGVIAEIKSSSKGK